jgi:dolichol-phosphate mannosyltransferase
MKCIVVIGTYNEAENIPTLLPEIMALGEQYEAIVVDDNSPDGTGELVEELSSNQPRIHAVHRARRLGYGTAYIEGFSSALHMGADYVIQMDADYSHNPQDIPRLVEAAADSDVAIGSRYARGGRTQGWPLHRRVISRTASRIARLLLGVPLNDFTGGFKCFPRSTLESLNFALVKSHGFASLYEINYQLYRSGKRFIEVPILFIDRRAGQSKLSFRMILEAWGVMFRLRLTGGR